MMTARPSPHPPHSRPSSSLRALCLLAIAAIGAPFLHAQIAVTPAPRVSVATRAVHAIAANAAVDAGQLPFSQPLTLTIHLRPTTLQTANLDHLLTTQTDAGSPSYHHWLTTSQFAAQFGPTPDQMAALTAWLQSNGLVVTAVSGAHTRLTVTGTAGQAQQAFAVKLHSFLVAGTSHFANAAEPSIPAELADLIAGISGLDNLPQPASNLISPTDPAASSPNLHPRILSTSDVNQTAINQPDSLVTIADAIDANTNSILTLTTVACSADVSPADTSAYRALFRQASAQGITLLATSSCATPTSSSFPASLAEVTALITTPQETTAATSGGEARPTWQAAPGLPLDSLRHEPDLTTTSAAAFAQTIATLNQQTGNRLGNVNAILYALAKVPGLFTQPDATPTAPYAGIWEPATGLGLIDLNTLLKVYPRGSGSTNTYLQSTNYAVNYGDSFTLKAQVIPAVYGISNPTGTVTFSASTQGTLGSSTIDNGGNASLTPDVLPVGVYSITATYSGDGSYSGSATATKVTLTISLVNAKLVATVSPVTNIPYGAAATVTATVTLPGANASPTGPVSAQISSGSLNSATLSPNPGSNSATTNITLSVPPPGTYNVQVTCQGTTNFQCQTPVNIPISTVKGYTNATVSVTPAAPQAGQPISLTATVVNSGNGSASYTYGGSISFYDSGKLLATAPVATNQATTTTTLSGTRTHNLTAVYTGDANWNASTSNAVAVLPTILPDSLLVSTNVIGLSSLAGVNIIFTGSISTTVTYQSGPTGTLTFFDTFNNAVIQLGNPSAIVANGPYASIGIFTTTGLQPGVHRIYAQYSGDDNYASNISPVLTLALSDFSLTMTPSTLTLAQGKTAQVTAVLGASGGFNGNVSLGCTPPGGSEATCNISPSFVAIGQSATITVTTTAPRSLSSHPSDTSGQTSALRNWSTATGATLATLLFFLAPRRRSLASLFLVLLAVSLTANLGCGLGTTTTTAPVSGTGSNPSDPGTPLGTENYIITASGSDGVSPVRHTYQYQVTVQ